MIRAEVNDGDVTLGVEGNMEDILAETMILLHSIHVTIAADSVVEGYLFEQTIRHGLDLIFKPRPEDVDLLKNKVVGGFKHDGSED